MKYKNNWILFIIFLISLACTTDSSAIILKDYNHDNLVQPIPIDANGNVIHYNNTAHVQNPNNNSNLSLIEVKLPATAPTGTNSATNTVGNAEQKANGNSGPDMIVWFIIFIFSISTFIFWGYRRLE
jgi:hypothetical protein